MKKYILLLTLAACKSQNPSVKSIAASGVHLQVIKDATWLKTGDYEGFRVRITCKSDRVFSKDQQNEMDYGMQDEVRLNDAPPVFIQKIATGIQDQAEYLIAFEKTKGKETLQITDDLFGLGHQSLTW